jgi:multidrug efflux pump subunit AcrA (membrane-fusion protein)
MRRIASITVRDAPTPTPRLGREEAVARLRSPERLDEVVHVTSSRTWIAVCAGVVALALAAVWAFFGTIPERLAVDGYMTRDGAIAQVFADVGGVISSVAVVSGDRIEPHATVASLVTDDGERVDVTAGTGGVVQGVAIAPGQVVEAGAQVATIVDEASTATLGAVVYVTAGEAQGLRRVGSVTVQPAAAGSVEGELVFVADVPATREAMVNQLGSAALADAYIDSTHGVPYLVLVQVPHVDGGVVAGAPAQISAIVKEQRPIDRLFGS